MHCFSKYHVTISFQSLNCNLLCFIIAYVKTYYLFFEGWYEEEKNRAGNEAEQSYLDNDKSGPVNIGLDYLGFDDR